MGVVSKRIVVVYSCCTRNYQQRFIIGVSVKASQVRTQEGQNHKFGKKCIMHKLA